MIEQPRDPRHRQLIALPGPLERSADAALAAAAGAASGPRSGLWVGRAPPQWPHEQTDARGLRRYLGRGFDVVVLDDPDPDMLGRAHGCVVGGGRLIVRLSAAPSPDRWRRRLLAAIARTPRHVPEPFAPPPPPPAGTAEQAAVVETLRTLLTGPPGAAATLIADRGRGKSAALGLALRGLDGDVALTGPGPDAVAEVCRFCPAVEFTPLRALLAGNRRPAIIVVDEAAQVPVPALRRLVRRHPDARLAFATTTRGYEGTGRGFVLRFTTWLEDIQRARGRPLTALSLQTPIRWAADDPVERFVFDALLLDARPDPINADAAGPPRCVTFDRDALAADDARLRAVFGLLVHAHYRTTPRDLALLLDGPGVHLHGLLIDGRVAAVNLLVDEGRLPPDVAEGLFRGARSIRGQALPETLAADCGRPDAAGMKLLRSVRIATHPALRRRGLGATLAAEVHRLHRPDLFGTVFGATPAVLAFRRAQGYRLVRLGLSGGRRAGEPAAVMIRPCSAAAQALVRDLRVRLAVELPRQLELMATDQIVAPALIDAVLAGLPAPRPDRAARDAAVAAYAFGPRGFESVGASVMAFVEQYFGEQCFVEDSPVEHGPAARATLSPADRDLIERRVLRAESWASVGAAHGGVRAAMRQLRRAVRALVRAAAPELEEQFRGPASAP